MATSSVDWGILVLCVSGLLTPGPRGVAHAQDPALSQGLVSPYQGAQLLSANSPVSGSAPHVPSAVDILASLTPAQIQALTPQQRLQLRQIMQQQQQEQLRTVQELQQQLQQTSSTGVQPLLVGFTGESQQQRHPQQVSYLLSGANAQQGSSQQSENAFSKGSQLSPLPFQPPPGAARAANLLTQSESRLFSSQGSTEPRMIGSALAGAPPGAPPVPHPSVQDLKAAASRLQQSGLPHGQLPKSEQGPQASLPPELIAHMMRQSRTNLQQSPLQQGQPVAARNGAPGIGLPHGQLPQREQGPRASLPPELIAHMMRQSRTNLQQGQAVTAKNGEPEMKTSATSGSMTCPRLLQGAVCSGTFHHCNVDGECAAGAKCCSDACGMICKTASPADAAILPGSLLVAQCINPQCATGGGGGFLFSQSQPRSFQHDCDAIKACNRGHRCCFDGCSNICQNVGQSQAGSFGSFAGNSAGQMDPMMLMMLAGS